jgi:FkbM family methyltransferase
MTASTGQIAVGTTALLSEPDCLVRCYVVRGTTLAISDTAQSAASEWIANELRRDEYCLHRIDFRAGDVIIDVGAHVGLCALYIAKQFPDVSVIAIEPDPVNFRNLEINIALNEVDNVVTQFCAVTKDRRPFPITSPPYNTGGAGGYYTQVNGYRHSIARSVTLDDIFETHNIKRCTLLKMDCEGAEHEILPNTRVLGRVGWLSGEFHINEFLRQRGCSNEQLMAVVQASIPPERLAIKSISMGE